MFVPETLQYARKNVIPISPTLPHTKSIYPSLFTSRSFPYGLQANNVIVIGKVHCTFQYSRAAVWTGAQWGGVASAACDLCTQTNKQNSLCLCGLVPQLVLATPAVHQQLDCCARVQLRLRFFWVNRFPATKWYNYFKYIHKWVLGLPAWAVFFGLLFNSFFIVFLRQSLLSIWFVSVRSEEFVKIDNRLLFSALTPK